MTLCAPATHPNTVLLALRILLIITKYPTLRVRFRDGASNSGWLSEADAAARNRAAVLLGFSVSARSGTVGSHIDVSRAMSRFFTASNFDEPKPFAS